MAGDGSATGREAFGLLADGSQVERMMLQGEGLSLSVLSYGALIQQIAVETPAGPRPVTLGLATLDDYVRYSPSMGIVPGRYANRIRAGQFMLDGKAYQLTCNENGKTHLHGGARGFGRRAWTVEEATPASVVLSIVSEDGEEGYPGRLEAQVAYRLVAPLTLRIEMTATTDAPTIINLATHSYFNLAGGGDVRRHRLLIAADRYLPVDADLIPTGEIRPVTGSAFDFRECRPIQNGPEPPPRYDHTFVVAMETADQPRRMARVEAPDGDLALEVWSTEPGVQFYDGGKLAVPVPGLGGRTFAAFAGLCLEPQHFPNSPNEPAFPSVVLRPGQTYKQLTEYRFSV